MDELKLLIEMVAHLPQTVVWVLVGYLVYKLAVMGSIYGLLRLAIEKMYQAHENKTRPKNIEVGVELDGVAFDSASTRTALMVQLHRLRFIGNAAEAPSYSVHAQYGVKKLREAIDLMVERDANK